MQVDSVSDAITTRWLLDTGEEELDLEIHGCGCGCGDGADGCAGGGSDDCSDGGCGTCNCNDSSDPANSEESAEQTDNMSPAEQRVVDATNLQEQTDPGAVLSTLGDAVREGVLAAQTGMELGQSTGRPDGAALGAAAAFLAGAAYGTATSPTASEAAAYLEATENLERQITTLGNQHIAEAVVDGVTTAVDAVGEAGVAEAEAQREAGRIMAEATEDALARTGEAWLAEAEGRREAAEAIRDAFLDNDPTEDDANHAP